MQTIDLLRTTLVAATLALAACTGGKDAQPADPAPPPAEMRVGGLHIIASVVETMTLPPQVAQQYGIPRAKDTNMLLVSVRRGPDGQETAVPAKVQARVQMLNGNMLDIPMRETRTAEEYVDNIGTFKVAPPDTLQFTLEVTPEGAPPATMAFSREVVH